MKLIIPLLLVTLLFTACPGTNPGNDLNLNDFRVGFDGVEFDFFAQSPLEIYEGGTRPLILLAHNQGAYDITEENPLYITITYDQLYLSLQTPDGVQDSFVLDLLDGKNRVFPFGEETEIILGNLRAKKLLGNIESPDTNVFVNLCYPYKTVLFQEVCISTDVYQTNDRLEVCEPAPIRIGGGQGAPIAITDIETDLLVVGAQDDRQRVSPLFRITIKNMNNGVPFFADNPGDFCSLANIDRSSPNKLVLTAWMNPSESDEKKGLLDCSPLPDFSESVIVQLRDGEATIVCSLQEGQELVSEYNFAANLLIEIDYIYSEGKSLTTEIFRTPTVIN